MFIEIVDLLRCPAAHEETGLVLAADRMEGRRIVEGTLGCPACRATYVVRAGEAWIGATAPTELDGTRAATAPPATPSLAVPDEDAAMRMAALLHLIEPQARVLLMGTRGRLAAAIAQVVPVECLVIDPPADVRAGEGVSIVRTGARLPLAPGSMAAAALGAEDEGPDPAAIVGAVRARGRVVGPATRPVPAGVREMVRDAHDWVGERDASPLASSPVALTLARRAGPRAG